MMRQLLGGLAALSLLVGCSSSKVRTTPQLSYLHGKKIALVDIDGEPTDRQIVEVALVNQLIQRGTFDLVSKQDVEQARVAPSQDPMDWKGIARNAGADYALRAKVLKFDAVENSGYSSEVVNDTQMAEEMGEENHQTTRLYKVKSLDGHVQVQLEFTPVSESAIHDQGNTASRTGIADASDKAVGDEREGAIHLPPRLEFLEKIANEAFRRFFDQYN